MWIFVLFFSISWADAQSKYPETISVLQTVYSGEMQVHLSYLGFAQKANSENYPNIAHLFLALANSELIHARNFRKFLSDLGTDVKEISKPETKILSTKENLKSTTKEPISQYKEIERMK